MTEKEESFIQKLKKAVESGEKNDEITDKVNEINKRAEDKMTKLGYDSLQDSHRKNISENTKEVDSEKTKNINQEEVVKQAEINSLIKYLTDSMGNIFEIIHVLRDDVSRFENNDKFKKDPAYQPLFDKIDEIKNKILFILDK